MFDKKQKTMNEFHVSEAFMQQILNYLQTRPYNEVYTLANAILSLKATTVEVAEPVDSNEKEEKVA